MTQNVGLFKILNFIIKVFVVMQQEGAQLGWFLSDLARFMRTHAYINICSYLEQMLPEPRTQEQNERSCKILVKTQFLHNQCWILLCVTFC